MARGFCERWQRILLLPASFFCACSAWSGPLAPAGEAGVLEINVAVAGSGSEQAAPGAGWTSRRWSVKHSATYRLAMVASSAIVDGEESGAAVDPANDTDQEAYWEQKTEACAGDPTCEMQVAMAQMQSPEAQAQMQQMGEIMSAAQMGAGGPATAQTWRVASRSGSVLMEQHDDTFGVISETGGGLVDVLCTSTIDQALDSKPSAAAGPVPATITIDGNSSSYTLQLPLEDRFLLKRLCTTDGQAVEDPRGQPTLLLGDNPAEASSWAAVLQVRGTYTGESAAPVFEGSREIPVAVLNASNRKAKAIVTWRFHPGGS